MVPIESLNQSPLFAGLDREALTEIAHALTVETWPRQRQILTPKGTAMTFRIVRSGRVKVTRSNSQDGRELTLWLLGPGDAFDIVSLLDGASHDASVWSLDAVETLAAPLATARNWVLRYPTMQRALLQYAAARLRTLGELAADLALHDTATRLGLLLLRHAGPASHARGGLIRNLPQEELASLIGSVRVVVSRLLGQLKRDSLIVLDRGALRITDLKRMLERVEAGIAHGSARKRRGSSART